MRNTLYQEVAYISWFSALRPEARRRPACQFITTTYVVKASRLLRSRVRPNLGPFPSKARLLNRSFGVDGVASYSVTSIPQNVSMTSACQTMLWSPTSSHCPSGYIRTAQKFRLRPYFAARATARLKRRYATDAEVDSKDPSGKDKSLSSMTVDFEHSGHC